MHLQQLRITPKIQLISMENIYNHFRIQVKMKRVKFQELHLHEHHIWE